jgi:hypothetical protein
VRRFDAFGFVKSIKLAYNAPLNNNDYSARNNNNKSNRRDDSDSDDNDVYYETNTKSKNKNEQDYFQWYAISVPSVEPNDSVKVRFFNGPVSLDDLSGFNNTGNICECFRLIRLELSTCRVIFILFFKVYGLRKK